MKRGQAAFEYFILVGAVLVVLMALMSYVFYTSSQNLKIDQTEDAVQTLAKTADALYALGPGNKDQVWINIPGSVSKTNVSGNEILIQTFLFGDNSDFYATTKATVNGSLPTTKGRYKVYLKTLDSGTVQIDIEP